MNMVSIAAAFGLLVVLAFTGANAADPSVCPSALSNVVKSTHNALTNAINNKSGSAVQAMFGASGVLLAPHEPPLVGEEIAVYMNAKFQDLDTVSISTVECGFLGSANSTDDTFTAFVRSQIDPTGMDSLISMSIITQPKGGSVSFKVFVVDGEPGPAFVDASLAAPVTRSLRASTPSAEDLVVANPMDNPQLHEIIYHQDVKFVEAYLSGKAANVAALYTSDAFFSRDGLGTASGNANIEAVFAGLMQTGVTAIKLEPITVGIAPLDSLVYDYSQYVAYMGSTAVDTGKYLAIWKLVGGEYLLYRQYMNSNLSE